MVTKFETKPKNRPERNGSYVISPATRGAVILSGAYVCIVHHFAPCHKEIKKWGVFHTDQESRLPKEKLWQKFVMLLLKAIMRHESWDKDEDEMI